MPKVKFGLSNVHYAVYDEQAKTYDTPVAIPGAVNLTFEQEGDTNKFRADNTDYYVSVSNNGYSGDFEVALIPDSFRIDVLGEIVDATKGIQYERADTLPKPFALMFQFEDDVANTRHVLYYCKATRPSLASQTTEESIEPVTETLSLTATAVGMTVGSEENVPMVRAKAKPEDSVYATWFTAVQVPTA